jgi:hypothetical protein
MRGWRYFLTRAGVLDFFCGSREKFPNCLDEKERGENLRSVNNSKYYVKISKVDRGLDAEKFVNQFANKVRQSQNPLEFKLLPDSSPIEESSPIA